MSPAPNGGKRGRVPDPEEDVYVDNLHSHKRYLTEIMASSMNGLSVGDSAPDNIMGSPMRLENAYCIRDEMSMQYSPMSEESDDYRYYDIQVNTNGNQTDVLAVVPAVVCSPARRGCGTEQEGRIPSSPNDMCHGGDLRRAALLRSVQMRVQNPHPCDVLPSSGHEQEQGRSDVHADELEQDQKEAVGVQLDQRPLSCPNSTQDAKYQSPINPDEHPHHDVDFVEDQITV
ncbi:unnamed protein product [Miscanthus lutarioriparius]|uniref:Uncharacterized protein n=1 Tax=Miscanthus lutarioriparius TaxID=422564 RepID=A0A811NZY3_9POAL|nr:unnamed protein product [Miscanthus lutarioriparius]